MFNLSGIGESPMALDHIVIPCKCRQTTSYTVNVPNYAPYKLAYKVITDIPCLDGGNLVSVMKVSFSLMLVIKLKICLGLKFRGEIIGTPKLSANPKYSKLLILFRVSPPNILSLSHRGSVESAAAY